MALRSNSLLLLTFSIIVIASIFCHVFAAIDVRKLPNSFKRILNTLDSSSSHGDWQRIKDTNNLKVVNIAKFGLNAENSRSLDVELVFQSVLNGRFRVDNNGITYELTISAIDFDEESKCKVVIFENSKNNDIKLISLEFL
ncbi:hypothetical protein BC332_34732 [Capsicum chinense]|nr:hypothetical protein BC332_34732 [Capsicum chinense]